MSITNRKSFIDYMKAFAIFLVIFGHSALTAPLLKQPIYAVHMPLFFFVYGQTYNIQRHEERGFLNLKFILDRARRLLIPYVIWAFLWLLICGEFDVKDILCVLYGSQSALKDSGTVTSLWFLPCLFLAVLLFEALQKLVHKLKCRNILLIVSAVCAIAIARLLPRLDGGYPWGIDVSFMAYAIITLGYLLQPFVANVMEASAKREREREREREALLFVCAAAVFVVTYRLNTGFLATTNNVDMASANYGLATLFIAAALAGLLMLCIVSKYLSRWFAEKRLGKVILFLGQNTIGIFLLHKPIIQFVCGFIKIGNAILRQCVSFGISVVILFLCALITMLIRKFLPEIIGEKRKAKPTQAI